MATKETKEKVEEFNLDKKVTVRSIAGWPTYFSKITELGDVTIPADGSIRLSRNEIIAQVQSGNKLFSGFNGIGDHATLYVEDAETRKELGFDSEDGSQVQTVLNEKMIRDIFAIKTIGAFEKAVRDAAKTRGEKYALVKAVEKFGLNDYKKIMFLTRYTGYKVEE